VNLDWVGKFKTTSTPYNELFFLFKPAKLINKNSVLDKPKIFIGGLQELDHENYTHMYETQVKKGFVVVFKALGFFRLLKINTSEFTNYMIDDRDIRRSELEDLWMELNALEEPIMMKNATDRVFESILGKTFPAYGVVDLIFDIIEKNNGILRSGQLAKNLNISQRKLQRIMKDGIGISAKELMQIFRFNFVINNINSLKSKNLTYISYLSGYFDQAHFIKDFKRITGKTPRILSPENADGSILTVDNRVFVSQD